MLHTNFGLRNELSKDVKLKACFSASLASSHFGQLKRVFALLDLVRLCIKEFKGLRTTDVVGQFCCQLDDVSVNKCLIVVDTSHPLSSLTLNRQT